MLAWKFLRPGAVGPFSRVAWPPPGEDGAPGRWIGSAGREVELCRGGVHACRTRDLPLWIGAELWCVELGGPVVEADTKVVGSAGRLLAPVAAWDGEAAMDFAGACARHVRERAAHGDDDRLGGYASDVERYALGPQARRAPFRAAAVAGFIAAQAARIAGGHAAEQAERARQAEWLASRLGLA
jgi:hypothetical protein